MYEETLKRKPVRGYKNFIGVILLVYGALALMFIVGFVQKKLDITCLQYILIAGLALLGIGIVRGLVTEYVYAITQDRVQVIRKTGGKPRVLIEFPVSDVIKFGTRSEVSGALTGKRKISAVIGREGPETFYIVLAGAAVILNPTGVFTQKFREVYEKADC